jgi:tight adherence protein C
MFSIVFDKLHDGHFVLSVLVGIATIAAILSVAMPLLEADMLPRRMKSVGAERDRIRQRERERLSKGTGKVNLRQAPKAYMKQVVEWFSLNKWLGTEEAKLQMMMAGYRGAQAEVGFLFFRLVTPIASLLVSVVYFFFIGDFDWPLTFKFGAVLACVYAGLKAPEIFVRNQISKRQQSMSRAFPDAMDLLLICVESGMSIEHACRKVSEEIGSQSIPLAEEFSLTTAELSYLPDRRTAYENLAIRTGIEAAKQISTVLIQAERYGTPLGTALRMVSQESRSQRLLAAEKKAASLPPKLTVPMIVFFLPVLFCVILTPAIIQVTGANIG